MAETDLLENGDGGDILVSRFSYDRQKLYININIKRLRRKWPENENDWPNQDVDSVIMW